MKGGQRQTKIQRKVRSRFQKKFVCASSSVFLCLNCFIFHPQNLNFANLVHNVIQSCAPINISNLFSRIANVYSYSLSKLYTKQSALISKRRTFHVLLLKPGVRYQVLLKAYPKTLLKCLLHKNYSKIQNLKTYRLKLMRSFINEKLILVQCVALLLIYCSFVLQ